jgi:hypothetical protein
VHQSGSLRDLGQRHEADVVLAAAISDLERLPPSQELVDAYLYRSWAQQWQGQLREALEAVEQAMALSAQVKVAGSPGQRAGEARTSPDVVR